MSKIIQVTGSDGVTSSGLQNYNTPSCKHFKGKLPNSVAESSWAIEEVFSFQFLLCCSFYVICCRKRLNLN